MIKNTLRELFFRQGNCTRLTVSRVTQNCGLIVFFMKFFGRDIDVELDLNTVALFERTLYVYGGSQKKTFIRGGGFTSMLFSLACYDRTQCR